VPTLLRLSRPIALLVTSAVALLAWAAMLAAEADAARAAEEGARRTAMTGALVVQPMLAADGPGAAAGSLEVAARLGAPLALYDLEGHHVGGPVLTGDLVLVHISGTGWQVGAPVVDGTAGLGLTRWSGPITTVSLAVFVASTVALVVVVRRGRRRVAELERRFDDVAVVDTDTGLGNRARLLEDLEAMSAAVRRYGHRVAVVAFEIDGPVQESDVRSVAAVVGGHARSADRCYRLPGGKLVSVLAEQDEPGAAVAADRVRAAVEATGGWTVSAGVAVFDPARDIGPSDVLDRALVACHRAREAGGDRLAVGEAAPV
jgi:GGDEF domain-containing protein